MSGTNLLQRTTSACLSPRIRTHNRLLTLFGFTQDEQATGVE